MSITLLPSGRYRVQIYEARTRRNISVSEVLGLPKGTTWEKKREASAARAAARAILLQRQAYGQTVGEFWGRWTTDPLFARSKESTNIHNRERTMKFADAHWDRPIASISDADVSAWLAGGKHRSEVPVLRAMFNDARSPLAGRLVNTNPFAGLRLERSTARSGLQPPTLEQAQAIVDAAHAVSLPSFAGWLQTAMWTGMRPGELDGLKWCDVDLENGWITVERQFNAKSRTFTSPKNGKTRPVPLHEPAREAIVAQPQDGEFVFVQTRGEHWTPSSRAFHWKAVRARAGWNGTLYVATRHFAGWFLYEVKRMDAEDVAYALGHEDHGDLVKTTYGHRSRDAALERVKKAVGK